MKLEDDFEVDDGFEEEEKINPLVAAGIFLGLIIVAAFICAFVWSATHKDVGEELPISSTETIREIESAAENEIDEVVDAEYSEEESVKSGMVEEEAAEETDKSMAMETETASVLEDEVTKATEATGLEYTTTVEQDDSNCITTQDGRVIIFTDCDDYVRPKELVNLRTEPSTSQGESTVKCQITHADIVHRTGYSADSGWSRVEFYGELLYVVSSYVYNAEPAE